ncbi:MAG: hypothetical protein EAZ08_13665 [Cytophagales bacterium]|nr:MAG: hypothetical protein EAZ08_13665 [Cytophagales bacterium]
MPSYAQEVREHQYLHLIGTLGKIPVTMDLEIVGDAASGRFYFNKMGQPIYLDDGDFDAEIPNFGKENIWLSETYGKWEGKLKKDKLSGIWTSADGKKQLPFTLVENYAQSAQMIVLRFDNALNPNAATKVKASLHYPTTTKNGEVLRQLKNEIGKTAVGIAMPNKALINTFKFGVLDKFEKDKDIKETTVETTIFLNESNLLTISVFQSGKNQKGEAAGIIRSNYHTWDLLTGNELTAKEIFVENYETNLEDIAQEVIRRDYEGKVFGSILPHKFGILKGGMMFFAENANIITEIFVPYSQLKPILKKNSPIEALVK